MSGRIQKSTEVLSHHDVSIFMYILIYVSSSHMSYPFFPIVDTLSRWSFLSQLSVFRSLSDYLSYSPKSACIAAIAYHCSRRSPSPKHQIIGFQKKNIKYHNVGMLVTIFDRRFPSHKFIASFFWSPETGFLSPIDDRCPFPSWFS